MEAAAPGPISLVVVAVGVEDLIDAAPGRLDDLGIAFGGCAEQAGFHVGAIGHRHTGGQSVEDPADHLQVILTDHCGRHRLGHQRKLGG